MEGIELWLVPGGLAQKNTDSGEAPTMGQKRSFFLGAFSPLKPCLLSGRFTTATHKPWPSAGADQASFGFGLRVPIKGRQGYCAAELVAAAVILSSWPCCLRDQRCS